MTVVRSWSESRESIVVAWNWKGEGRKIGADSNEVEAGRWEEENGKASRPDRGVWYKICWRQVWMGKEGERVRM